MRKTLAVFLGLLATAPITAAAGVTPTEARWLSGVWPAVLYARQAGMPLDIVVQPQPTPGHAPLALAFVAGRCKLVLSMRGNPQAQSTLDRIEPDLLHVTLEMMAAHELGHCKRYLDGAWHGLPAGFVPREVDANEPAGLSALADMRAARREEGYGDLVGLAWTQQRHPRLYARLHAWLVAERMRDLVRGSHHDTLAWVRLVRDGSLLATVAHGSIFSVSAALWAAGLGAEP